MKTHPLLLPILLFAAVGSTAIAQPANPSMKLLVLEGKPVVDGVFLNGQGPYRFLLDTGSQSNQLDSSLARKLGLAATRQLDLQTPSGASSVPAGLVGQVNLGQLAASDQEFLFTRFDDLSTLPPDIRGILGQDFLSHFDYTLDFQHHRLIYGESQSAEPSATGLQSRFRLIFGRMAIPTNLGDLVLDSGAEMLFLFRASTRAASGQVIGASGARMAVSYERPPEIRIGDRTYRPAKAEYHAVPAAEESGLLPANLFHSIFICNSRQYVVFDPLP